MVAIVQRYTSALASGLIPLLSRLSAGTEMASYGNAQWEFLLSSDEVTAFVAVDDVDATITNTQLLGCLLRIDMEAAPELPSDDHVHNTDDHTNAAAVSAATDNHIGSTAAGFGMMLVRPEARGRGLAKLLLHEAMSGEDERRKTKTTDRPKTITTTTITTKIADSLEGEEEILPRKLLVVCTTLGQPLYRSIGFSEVGRVTALSATVRNAREIVDVSSEGAGIRVWTYGSLDRTGSVSECDNDKDNENEKSSSIDPEIRDLIAAMDARATGWDRRGRLHKLMGHPCGENLRSIAAVATYQNVPIAAAILRQEGPGSPFVIGPMVGTEGSALPLVSALARAVPDESESEEDSRLSILVSEHPELVDRLTEAGFQATFGFPAMALDDRPIYENGDGSYLSLIHPTLG